ncbi:MAG: hypothetical protein Q8876_01100 [Bacillota bacterium]|nr:hypothetical protein [Bacillota bacterium]
MTKRKTPKEQKISNVSVNCYCPCDHIKVDNNFINDFLRFPNSFKYCPVCGAELKYSDGECEVCEINDDDIVGLTD